ncbi:hypothetical protein [Ferrovibrio sp.]|uniref:hypothetical protein n=1 Tax=Ferrovibrio sp. TaxID=1917215 RepID=UPI003D108281
MGLQVKNLALIASGNGFGLWHYKSADTPAQIDTAGYFNGAASMLNVGDHIYLHAGIGGTPKFGHVVVNANAGGVVDVADMVETGGTDTD